MPGTAASCRRWLGFHSRGQRPKLASLALTAGFLLTPTAVTEPDPGANLTLTLTFASSPSLYLTLIPHPNPERVDIP